MARNPKQSSRGKHSYVAFYMDAWAGGTARMTRLVRSVYFDVCFHNWDKVEPMSEADQMLAFDDLGQQAQQILNVLVSAGKIIRNADGSLYNEKAIEEALKSADLYARKSGGGKKGSAVTNAGRTPGITPAAIVVGEKIREEENPSDKNGGDSPPLVGEADEEEEKPEIPEGDPEPPAPRKSYDTAAIQRAWNEMACRNKLAQVVKMTEERRKKTRARIEEMGEAAILEAILLVPERPFLMGENDRRWKADYDFMVRPNTVTKILEGGAFMGGGKGSGWVDG